MLSRESDGKGTKKDRKTEVARTRFGLVLVVAGLAMFAVACEDNGGSGDDIESLCEDICDVMIECDGGDDDTMATCTEACEDLAELGEDVGDACVDAFSDAVECALDELEASVDADECEYGGELRDFLDGIEDPESFLIIPDEFCSDGDLVDEIEDSCDDDPEPM